MEITIEKELFQWERNRKVYVRQQDGEPAISYVQFYNKNCQSAPEVPLKDGAATIPDYLLREQYPIIAIACIGSEGDTKAIARKEFKVIKRPRPENYYKVEAETASKIIYDGGEEK